MTTAPVNSPWITIHNHLEKQIQRVRDEIRNYPAPIPACDAQFNHLLEERDLLSSELARVREHMSEDTDSDGAQRSIDAFLNASTRLDETAKSEIRAIIDNDNR